LAQQAKSRAWLSQAGEEFKKMNDPIGDMLTRIRNASLRGKSTVETPASKLRAWVLDVLADEGYIRGYESMTGKDGHPAIEISLKYYDGTPVIREVNRVSKPGRRVYLGMKDIPTVRQGLGVSIVSTSMGVMSDTNARAKNVGGEVLCTVF
jgi:small subunit ribosomal protein S8